MIRYFIVFAILLNGQLYAQDDLSTLIMEHLKKSEVPALATAAYYKGELVASGCSGVRKKGSPEKVTIDDKYHLGSCTKSMTSLLAAILIKEKKIHWDTSLRQVFRGVRMDPEYHQVTLRQLLNHTAGTPKELDSDYMWKLRKSRLPAPQQRLDFTKTILAKKPSTSPGKSHEYSNTGYAIAGTMLEAITRKSYESMLQEKIFKPLGLSSAGFRAPATNGVIDQPYGHKNERGRVYSIPPEPFGDESPALAPATTVHLNILDFVKYASYYLQKEPVLITEELKKEIFTASEHKEYGLGWELKTGLYGDTYRHSGSNSSFISIMVVIPEHDFTAVVLANMGGIETVRVCELVLQELQEKYLLIH